MKKLLLAALFLMLVNVSFTQNRAYIVNEKFNAANMPSGWYFTGDGADNFDIKTTNNAGGDPNELHLKSSPFITSGIHLVMASANLTGVENVGISFKHYLNNYQQTSTIGIATSSDNGATWNTAWSMSFSGEGSSGQYSVNETVSTPDMGKNNVLFCLFYEGNTYNINHWYFDDIMIFTQGGSDENGADLQLSNIDVNSITQAGTVEVSFSVNNTGFEDVTTFDASYEINGNTVTETFTCSLSPSDNSNFSFETAAYLMPGTCTINLNIESVNGADDTDNENNSLSKEIRVFMKTVTRTPMIEHFSSSTCQPCVAVDNAMVTLTENNPGKYTYTKYPMNMPYTGDPYFINECLVRADYYGVEGVPCIALDGALQQSAVSQSALDERLNVTSYVDIIGAFQTNGNTINLTADIISYIDLNNVKVFLTINEKTTTENASTNGMTEFHHIIMKMLGSDTGIETNLYAGQYQRFEFSADMSDTNVEEMEDLEVAVWIQDYESKDIYNSHYLYEYTEHPYPAQNLQVNGNVISWEAPEQGSPSAYKVYVNNEMLTDNLTTLSYTVDETIEIMTVEVFAVYDGHSSIGITNLIHSGCDAPQNVEATANVTNISVSWDAVDEAVKYQLYRNGELLAELSENEYTDNDIELGISYCYNLRSICAEGYYSGFSEKDCAQVGEKPCDAPTGLKATVEQDVEGFEYEFKVTMSWDKVNYAQQYKLYLDGELLETTTETSFVKGFDEEGEHYFTVATICENGESEQSESFEFEVKGVSIDEIENIFSIYPNPAKDFIKLSTVNGQLTAVKIYNYLGILVEETEAFSNEVEINVSAYNTGIYFIEAVTERESKIIKIVKE